MTTDRPGQLVTVEPVAAPAGAAAWRVVYRSLGVADRLVDVSGLIVVPEPRSSSPLPVIAWAHGTTGLADRCAPSALARPLAQAPADLPLPSFWDAGYAVVATDYEGLGTPGRHPYLVGESEARSILDAVRAARWLAVADATGDVAVVGVSQGGHAALFAGEVQSRYAPEVALRGVVALAPATELFLAARSALADPAITGLAVAIGAGFEAAYPEARLAEVVSPAYASRLSVVDEGCIDDVVAAFAGPASEVLRLERLEAAPWPELIERNSPGRVPTAVPIFVGQGGRDPLVLPEVTETLVARVCRQGADVTYRRYPAATHDDIGPAASEDVLAWLANVLAGRHVRSEDCPG